jgi:hypothetical protein
MRASVGFVFWAGLGTEVLRASTLGRMRWARIRSGCLTASCAMGLACLYISPGLASAQDAPSSTVSALQKTGASKTASPKRHAKVAAHDSAANTTTSPRKRHPASHPAADKHPKSSTAVAAHNGKIRRSGKSTKKKITSRGQQKIEPERAQAIQEALIREGYLSGEAAGTWNQASEDAMRKYQADHGWQSKTVPDSRALISLGLGPSHDHLLNPESAMTTGPEGSHASLSSTSQNPISHSADPGARMNVNQSSPVASPSAATSEHDSTGPQ